MTKQISLANEMSYVAKLTVCCVFGKRDPLIKLSLLKAYCSSFYGSVLWDLSHSSMNVLCAICCKGLRRILNLPHNTHCPLLPLLCGLLPLMDELPAGVLRVAYTVIVRSLVLLHDTAFSSRECFLPLAATPCSVVDVLVCDCLTLDI